MRLPATGGADRQVTVSERPNGRSGSGDMFDEDVRRFGVSKPMTETSIRCLVSRVWPPAANRPRHEPAVEAGRG